MARKNRSQNIAVIAVFFAVMLVVHLLSSLVFNFWPVPIKPTIIHIPVIIASIVYGPRVGGTLGGLMGLVSVIHNTIFLMPTSYLFSPFVAPGNVYSLIIALVPRIMIGILPYFVYKYLKNRFGLLCAGAVGSATNTVLVLSGIFIFFVQANNSNVKAFLATIVWSNSIAELLIATVVTVIAVPRLQKLKK
ncbi:ECF transporter S component [Streptococcus ferus]|uniref:Membrane protein n=1 Tax=Streptococcus ferus TaxID=1345 RepID=A0A2X3VRN0_9STRE|nr:ECF transporter S component [Streptococcus ferus]SQF40385.1 membrane protein [Streptococcus ferus]